MTLTQLRLLCAAYHHKVVGDFTVAGVDVFLQAANNARKNAELLHNFQATRVLATLNIDGETGGDLANAVFTGNSSQLLASGTLTPNVAGVWSNLGSTSIPLMGKVVGAEIYYLQYSQAVTEWFVTRLSDGTSLWEKVADLDDPLGIYTPATGTGTLTFSSPSVYSGIKEIIAAQRTNQDGSLEPLDFTSPDIAIERTRAEIELSEDYALDYRYPSDRSLLLQGEYGTLIQRGSKLFVYPQGFASSTPLGLTIECYAWLSDYTSSSYNDVTPTDFFLEHGHQYMQWATIVETNYLFQTFVPRTEGTLTSPEAAREDAFRKLLLWDSYSVDSHGTRSR